MPISGEELAVMRQKAERALPYWDAKRQEWKIMADIAVRVHLFTSALNPDTAITLIDEIERLRKEIETK